MKKFITYFRSNLKLKIMVPLVSLYIVVSVFIYFFIVTSVSNTLQKEFVSKGKAIVNAIASAVQETSLNGDPATIQTYIEKYRDVEGISFIIILDENYNIVAHTFYPKVPDEYLKKINREKELNLNKTNEDLAIDEEVIADRKELVLSRPILNGLVGQIYMGMDIEKRESEITSPLTQGIILILSVCVLIAVSFTILFLDIILKPIISLTKVAESYSNDEEQIVFADITSEDEVGKLAKSFYQMIGKITENKAWLEQEVKNRTKIIQGQQMSLVHSSKMSALGEMAGGIAHEINTPLAIIGMKIEQINDSIDEKDLTMEDLKKSLDIIKATSNRIAKIINGLQFFARDGSQVSLEKTSLDTILEDTLSFCSEKMRLSDVKFEILKDDKKIFLNCRAVEISQVLLNLLNNANDAIVTQETKWIRLQVDAGPEEVEISVIDNGPGIPKDIQNKIMQPFFTTKEPGKGTGLGLSISRGIMDSHRGKFYIDNNYPHTKFTIVLPRYVEESAHGKEDQSA